MYFSLVVVTTNRFNLVDRLFYSLVSQKYKNFEILFVSGEAYTAEAKNITEKFSELNIKTFNSPSMSISVARNLALAFTKGDFIAFPDDDCVYSPDTLQAVNSIFNAHQKIDGLLGSKVNINWNKCPHSACIDLTPVKSRYDAFRNSETFLQFYRKRCVQKIGSFDEKLGPGTSLPYGSGEDTDYVLRAFKAGFTLYRAPGVVVAHPTITFDEPKVYSKAHSYAVGRMYLLQKHSMPLWFKLANIFYPLCRIPLDCLPILRYRWVIFRARFEAGITTWIYKRYK